jgi:hypothetical protein
MVGPAKKTMQAIIRAILFIRTLRQALPETLTLTGLLLACESYLLTKFCSYRTSGYGDTHGNQSDNDRSAWPPRNLSRPVIRGLRPNRRGDISKRRGPIFEGSGRRGILSFQACKQSEQIETVSELLLRSSGDRRGSCWIGQGFRRGRPRAPKVWAPKKRTALIERPKSDSEFATAISRSHRRF